MSRQQMTILEASRELFNAMSSSGCKVATTVAQEIDRLAKLHNVDVAQATWLCVLNSGMPGSSEAFDEFLTDWVRDGGGVH